MWSLCPSRMPGRPGTLTPVTDRPGARSATWYQTEGMVCGRCGSPASMALPPATAGPLTAHALLSGERCTAPAGSALTWARSADAAVASAAGTVPAAALVVAPVSAAGAAAVVAVVAGAVTAP